MKRNNLWFIIHFTSLLICLGLILSLTACSEPTPAEPTPTVEPYHTDTDVDGVCDGCGETLDYLFDQETNTYTFYTAAGLYAWNNTNPGIITTNLTLAKDIALPAEMKYDLNRDGVNESNWQPKILEGTIVGNQHTISNLVIQSSGNETGFIGSLRANSSIQNLHLTNASVEGANNVGGIVGLLYGGAIRGCANYASVAGDNSTGGSILACYNVGRIQTVGLAYGSSAGGIVGRMDTATVKACYSISTVIPGTGSNPMAGGVVGYSQNGALEANFWCTSESGLPSFGNGGQKANENAAHVDGTTLTWASAAEQMNNALTQGLYSWKYVVNTGADQDVCPLILEPVAS